MLVNETVLLRERKRHTASRVVSTHSVILTRGYPIPDGGYPWVPPHPGPDGDTPSLVGHPSLEGYPIPGWECPGVPPCPGPDGGTPSLVGGVSHPWWGYPIPGGEGVSHPWWEGCTLGYPHPSPDGVPPSSRPGWGNPPAGPGKDIPYLDLAGVPPCLDLAGVSSLPAMVDRLKT